MRNITGIILTTGGIYRSVAVDTFAIRWKLHEATYDLLISLLCFSAKHVSNSKQLSLYKFQFFYLKLMYDVNGIK